MFSYTLKIFPSKFKLEVMKYYRTSSKKSALLIIRHPLPNDGK